MASIAGILPKSTYQAITTHGLRSSRTILRYHKDETVDTLCSVIRKPGGASIGNSVSPLAQDLLKLGVRAVRHTEWIQHKVDLYFLTGNRLDCFIPQKDLEDAYKPASVADMVIAKFNKDDQIIPFETFTNFLKTQCGAKGVPLTHVVRERIYAKGPYDNSSMDVFLHH